MPDSNKESSPDYFNIFKKATDIAGDKGLTIKHVEIEPTFFNNILGTDKGIYVKPKPKDDGSVQMIYFYYGIEIRSNQYIKGMEFILDEI